MSVCTSVRTESEERVDSGLVCTVHGRIGKFGTASPDGIGKRWKTLHKHSHGTLESGERMLDPTRC